MSNLLTAGLAYDPYFYANAALEQLWKALGMAAYVHRDYEDEKGLQPGSTIQIRRPGVMTAQSMPIAEASATDVTPEYLNMVLDQWKGSMFTLNDKELSYTREKVVDEHIAPAAVAVADAIDQTLAALYADVGWIVADDSSTPTNDFPNLRQKFFDNKVADRDRSYMIDGVLQNRYEKEATFYQANTGVDADKLQRDGYLTKKFGFDIFANQNSPTHSAGTVTGTPITNGTFAKGATSVDLDAGSLSGDVNKGDVVEFAGDAQDYAITADATVSGNAVTVAVSPALQAALGDGVATTLTQTSATSVGLAWYKNAFALAMAPLSTMGNALGARMATVSDPITGITLRSRIWYTGGSAQVFVSIDALWGVRTLDPNMAVRLEI